MKTPIDILIELFGYYTLYQQLIINSRGKLQKSIEKNIYQRICLKDKSVRTEFNNYTLFYKPVNLDLRLFHVEAEFLT